MTRPDESRDRAKRHDRASDTLPPADVSALLRDRAIVVTGASRGIGHSIAERCLEAGADVLAVSRRDEGPHGSATVALDVRSPEAPEQVLAACLKAFGRVDGLVNNAGIIHYSDCWDHPVDAWDDLFATNLTAPFRLSQRVVQHWLAQGQPGAIVHMCSIESELAMPSQAGYAATKGGLLALTRSMALDLAPHGIRVTAIGPGVIDTGMSEAFRAVNEGRIPLGRPGLPVEIADCVIFLLSELSRYVAGAILYADGGYMIQ